MSATTDQALGILHSRTLLAHALLALVLAVTGCTMAAPTDTSKGGRSGATSPGTDDAEALEDQESPMPGSTASTGPTPQEGPLGVVIIDVQQSFVNTATRRNPGSGMPERVRSNERLLSLAAKHQAPVFVTYEATKTGTGAMPASVQATLPQGSQEFIKTTFGAMGLPSFAEALRASGLRRFVVAGAETDVCVLQTMMGMREAGYAVYALKEAMFTEEVNVEPALARMAQSGIRVINESEAQGLLAGTANVAAGTESPTRIAPLQVAFALSGVAGLAAADNNAQAKRVRLRELLLLSEWFRIPVVAKDPAAELAALPSDLRSLLTRGIGPLSSLGPETKQLAVAGSHQGIAGAVAALHAAAPTVFVVEDALVGGPRDELASLYASTAQRTVPITYKTLYYELTYSVNDAEWPSPEWVTDGSKYYDLTMAPETLPPLR